MAIGLQDTPSTEDHLGIDAYHRGLASFLGSCRMPMTVAVQGEWGIGKTTTMQLVEGQLPSNCLRVRFNTWQYAQFDMGDGLVLCPS